MPYTTDDGGGPKQRPRNLYPKPRQVRPGKRRRVKSGSPAVLTERHYRR